MFASSRVECLLAGSALFLFASTGAYALQYQRISLDPPLIGIAATGPIVSGDSDRLDAFIRTLPQTDGTLGFVIDSPGGSIVEAEKIAAFINKAASTVTVPSDSTCASACFLLFAAAAHRFMGPNALIGVHSASENGEENLYSMGATTAFARDAAAYGVPDAIIGKLVATESGRMTWLTPTDLKPMGVVLLTSTSTEARPLPARQAAPIPHVTPPSTSNHNGISAYVTPAVGAPGDGQISLAAALKSKLTALGVSVASGPGSNVYTVSGRAMLSESIWGHQIIRIEWQVLDPNGKRLGTVSQQNGIPRGSLDGPWGAIATAAAGAAAYGIIKLLPRQARVLGNR
jgi:hypothetical protein